MKVCWLIPPELPTSLENEVWLIIKEKIKKLPTEQRNQDTLRIDEVSTLEMMQMINNEDKKVAFCMEDHLHYIAAAVDALAKVYAGGGRIVYCGAGTSGRMGFMDSAECPPTYGIEEGRIVSLIAGGDKAMGSAVEGAEDSQELCVEDLKKIGFNKSDALVGIAASGRTPYVIGGIQYAKSIGCKTVSITCNGDLECELNKLVDYPISIYAGPEVITGSTRMKSGTVQKLVLNMLSTGVMVKNGKVYSNLMVNVQTFNEKLIARAIGIVMDITDKTREEVLKTMAQTGNNVSLSIVMLLKECSQEEATLLLDKHNGHIKNALKY